MRKYINYMVVLFFLSFVFSISVYAKTLDEIKTGDTVKELVDAVSQQEEDPSGFFEKIKHWFLHIGVDSVNDIPEEYYNSKVTVMKDGGSTNPIYVYSYKDKNQESKYSAVVYRNDEFRVVDVNVVDKNNIKDGNVIYTYIKMDKSGVVYDVEYTDEDDKTKIENPAIDDKFNSGEGVFDVNDVPSFNNPLDYPTEDEGGGDGSISPIEPRPTNCGELFAGVSDILNEIFDAMKIVVPILVIGLSAVDFAKSIFTDNDEETKKAQGKFAKRLILALVFFLLPTFLEFAMSVIDAAYTGNWECIVIK